MSLSWIVTAITSGAVVLYLWAREVLSSDEFPVAVTFWAVALLFIGMVELWKNTEE